VNIAKQLVENTTGAPGAVTIIACLFIGAVSGSTPATVVAFGCIMIPPMVKYNCGKEHSTDKAYVTIVVSTLHVDHPNL
jgi:C4-dicarboxylate transporter DctM subunit